MALGVCVPFLNRNSLLHAKTETTSGAQTTESLKVNAVGDPNSYRFFTYDFVHAWVPGSSSGNAGTALNVEPYPKDGNPVWITGYNYSPTPCSDFADQGDWVGGLPADYTWLIHPIKDQWLDSGGGSRPSVKEYYKSHTDPDGKRVSSLVLSLDGKVMEVTKNPTLMYFLSSPSELQEIFYADVISVCAGFAKYTSCSESDPDSIKQRKRWGFTKMADHKSAHHFIGVINE